MTEFKQIPNWPRYEVSRQGVVRNRATRRRVSPVPAKYGQPTFNLSREGIRRCCTARQLVLTAFGKTWRPKWNPWDSSGENNGFHRLTEADVHEIRDLLKAGETQLSIARLFKTTQSHVWRIKHRVAWKHLKEQTQ